MGVKTILSILNDPNNDLPSLSRSNYYDILKREDQDEIKHHSLIKRIKEICFELKARYTAPGYRTITDHLHNEGFKINRKTVYRLMRKLKLIGYRMKRKKRYDSFEGEIEDRIKPDLIKRSFFAIKPSMKWYTDITEFNLRGQKLYLSPIIDGCGRDIVAYNISRHPNLNQAMTMLDDAFKAKNHNGANVITISASLDFDLTKEIIDSFIVTKNPNEERHLRRVNEIIKYEDEHYEH